MIIRASRPESGYAQLRNETLRDARLSFRARGVLAFILSHQEGYRLRSEDLVAQGAEGRDAIRSALAELQAAGYLSRRRFQDPEGHWVTESFVYDEPGDRSLDTRRSVSQALEEDQQEDLTTNPLPTSLALVGAESVENTSFEEFWGAFPKRNGKRGAKAPAATKWKKLNAAERAANMIAVGHYASAVAEGLVLSACDVTVWLNQRRWEDWQEPAVAEGRRQFVEETQAQALSRIIQERGF